MIPAADFKRFKSQPLVVVTAYDFPFAQVMEEAGVDVILVGDSLANVVLGHRSTRDVNVDVMGLFVGAVSRGAPKTHITADMPFGSYSDPAKAVANGRRFLSLGAHSVKVEGPCFAEIRAMVSEGIPVMGHVGLLPQTAKSFKQIGHTQAERDEVLKAAEGVAQAGAFSLVLEHMESGLGAEITRRVPAPTIGIGAGKGTDGQVLVMHDFLGLGSGPLPPFARAFADLRRTALEGARAYSRAVRERTFP
jgi:3-methyl-2-oxobutanoate hydroxymethyltransferase